MPIVNSFGLIDNNGNTVSGSGDFASTKNYPGYFTLTFGRDVRQATVTATPRSLPYCDNNGRGLTVCNPADNPQQLGFFIDDPNDLLGFSFMLIDDQDDDENQ
ncbi:MAG: hypothetical protein SX243_09670 [Acidobacteriota bacterium]|nr:hypothetical protein [Acidobacteriota bacterium]